MTSDQLTAVGVPAEHHATAQAAVAAGVPIPVILQWVTIYGPIAWAVVQEVTAFIHAGKFDAGTVVAEIIKVIAMLQTGSLPLNSDTSN